MNLILRGSVWRSCQKDPSGTEGCCPTNRGPSSRCPSWRLLSRWPRSVSCAPSFTRYSKVCLLQTIWTLRGVCRKASGFTLRLKTSITFVNSSLIFLWILLLLLYNVFNQLFHSVLSIPQQLIFTLQGSYVQQILSDCLIDWIKH